MKKRTILASRKKWLGVGGLLALALLLTIGITYVWKGEDIVGEGLPGLLLWETVKAQTVPPSPELLARGRVVYGVRCNTCHGSAGDGTGPGSIFLPTPPRDFTQLAFKLRTTEGFPSDLDLFRTITVGFPAYGMSGFHYLSENDRWALVYYLKELARVGWMEQFRKRMGEDFDPKEASTIVAERMSPGDPVVVGGEPASDAGSLSRGEALYAKACIDCHGESGRGDGPSAPTLEDNWGRPIQARDFGEAPVFRKAGWRLVDTVRVIKTGINGTPMPASTLTEPEAWDLARYVHQLREKRLSNK